MATFADKPTLTGELVVLRPLTGDDTDDMWADAHDSEGRRLTGTHGWFTREQVAAWCETRDAATDRLDLAIIDATTGSWVGEAVVNDWEPHDRSCNFRIALGPAGRDRGPGTEATQLIVDHVFDQINEPPVHRISLEVYDFNPWALRVYEKVGFRREGVLRDVLWWDGEFHDAIVMSILRTDRD